MKDLAIDDDLDLTEVHVPRRKCANPDCGTILSRYNHGDLCHACEMESRLEETHRDGLRPLQEEREERRARQRGNDVITRIQDVTETQLREHQVTPAGPEPIQEKTMEHETSAKKCKAEGCETELGERNRSGFCTRHIYMKYSTKSAGSKATPPPQNRCQTEEGERRA